MVDGDFAFAAPVHDVPTRLGAGLVRGSPQPLSAEAVKNCLEPWERGRLVRFFGLF